MSDQELPDPTSIPHLLATHVLNTSSASTTIQAQDLAAIIAEVTVRTQILGASFLTVTLIDPDWQFQTSGIIDVTIEGIFDTVEVNFPEGSTKWWRLCAATGTGDRGSANLTLTFEDRIIAYLRDHWGPIVNSSGASRAQFIKRLVDEVKANGGIKFVCPAINVTQPVASASTSTALGQLTVSTAIDATTAAAKTNKTLGLGAGAKVSVDGQALNRNQIKEATTLLTTASALNAGPIATQALIFAAIAESRLGGSPSTYSPNSAGYYGVLQGSAKTWPDPHDTAGMARAFLQGGKGFQAGGAMALSHGASTTGTVGGVTVDSVLLGGGPVSDPIEIAVRVEVPSIWPANAYATESGYSAFLPEAKAIIAAGGGTTLGSQIGTATGLSDISQLTRGTADNPDESSWDCIQRLAQQVTWFAFSNADTLYYEDGFDLVAQQPTAYIELVSTEDVTGESVQPDLATNGRRWELTDGFSGAKTADVVVEPSPNYTFDDTTYVYLSTHTRKGRIQRKSRTAKPSTPSEIQLNLICDIDFAHAGDVFVFQGCGPMNGRWVVTDATRNCLADLHTQFTLEPPLAPTPEPQATTAGTALTGSTGGAAGVTGYVNPLSGVSNLTSDRIDMGVDYSGNGDIVSPGNGTVYCTVGSGGWQPTFIGIKLSDGAYAGKSVYFAEHITSAVKVGQTVTAGQKIGTMFGGIECGWGTGAPLEALAASLGQQSQTGDAGAQMSASGLSFNNFLVSLGCKPGIKQAGGPHGTMPAGYPPAQ